MSRDQIHRDTEDSEEETIGHVTGCLGCLTEVSVPRRIMYSVSSMCHTQVQPGDCNEIGSILRTTNHIGSILMTTNQKEASKS